MGEGNQRSQNGDLHRLDGYLLRDNLDGSAGNFGPVWFFHRWSSDRPADCGATSPGFQRATTSPRLRASHSVWKEAAPYRLTNRCQAIIALPAVKSKLHSPMWP